MNIHFKIIINCILLYLYMYLLYTGRVRLRVGFICFMICRAYCMAKATRTVVCVTT